MVKFSVFWSILLPQPKVSFTYHVNAYLYILVCARIVHSWYSTYPVYEVHLICTGMGHVGQRYVEKGAFIN